MPRWNPLPHEQTVGKARQLLDRIQQHWGMTPNFVRTLAVSPAALDAYLVFDAALQSGLLSPRLRQQIALAISEYHGCTYGIGAYSAFGRQAGLTEQEILDSRRGRAADPATEALLHFARRLVETRGRLADEDLAACREAGVRMEEKVETVALVAITTYVNYFNLIAQPLQDFPRTAVLAQSS